MNILGHGVSKPLAWSLLMVGQKALEVAWNRLVNGSSIFYGLFCCIKAPSLDGMSFIKLGSVNYACEYIFISEKFVV
jgi:hypothetical protein